MSANKYIIDFHSGLYTKELAELEKQVENLNKMEALLAEVSDKTGKEIKSIQDFEKFLQNSMGIPNLFIAADAMNVKAEYQEACRLEELPKPLKSQVSKKGGVYSLKPSVKDTLKEKHTTYLPEAKRPIYDKVEEAVKILNGLPMPNRGCIRQNYEGLWVVNIHRFNVE